MATDKCIVWMYVYCKIQKKKKKKSGIVPPNFNLRFYEIKEENIVCD